MKEQFPKQANGLQARAIAPHLFSAGICLCSQTALPAQYPMHSMKHQLRASTAPAMGYFNYTLPAQGDGWFLPPSAGKQRRQKNKCAPPWRQKMHWLPRFLISSY